MNKIFLIGIVAVAFVSYSFKNPDEFKSYSESIAGVATTIDMVAIDGGEFMMGSPENEPNRKSEETQHQVKVDAFWMAKYETTWALYEVYFNKELEITDTKNTAELKKKTDAVAHPTQPYVEMSFGQGKEDGFPVCNVTQYAARSFCAWLYAKTGHFYRLPTEAEWEYAARAGTKTAYYWGNNPEDAKDYAWFYDNSDGAYKKVGQKKPNAWGLYDMVGNVAEWTSDQYETDFYNTPESRDNPYVKPTKLYPHVIRGGHWDDDIDKLRSATRRASTPELKQRDPQIPKSDWWLTDAPFLGFRVVRPLKEPSLAEIQAYYAKPPKDIP